MRQDTFVNNNAALSHLSAQNDDNLDDFDPHLYKGSRIEYAESIRKAIKF